MIKLKHLPIQNRINIISGIKDTRSGLTEEGKNNIFLRIKLFKITIDCNKILGKINHQNFRFIRKCLSFKFMKMNKIIKCK